MSNQQGDTIVMLENQKSLLENVKKPRIYFLDTLRTFLTLLVVIHHCFWVVVESANWTIAPNPWNMDTPTKVISYMVLSGDQAYFMGLFFFLSGFVTGPSYKRKGLWVFVKDRFLRLIIPVILYELVLFPLLWSFSEATWNGPVRNYTASTRQVYKFYFDNYQFTSNHMWFLVTLFWFSATAAIVLKLNSKARDFVFSKLPMNEKSSKEIVILLSKLSVLLIVLNYGLRAIYIERYIWLPVIGNIGFLAQYIVAFSLGMMANTYQFLDIIKREHLPWTLGIGLTFFWLFQIVGVFLPGLLEQAIGPYANMFLRTLFEQPYAVFWSYSLLVLFKQYQNSAPSEIFKVIIGAAFATYIIHQWIIVPVAVGLAYTSLTPALVILVLCITTPFLSWFAGILLKKIPGADMIL